MIGRMVSMAGLPRGVKLKLTWLLTALAVVWISGPGGGAEGTPSAATAAFASASSPAAVPAPAGDMWLEMRLSRGQVVELEGVRLGVLAMADEPASVATGAGEGARLISVYVALKNVGVHHVTYTALDLELYDDRGRYASLEARRGPGPMLTFGSLTPGEGVSGWRMFRVPAGAGPFRLAFALMPAL